MRALLFLALSCAATAQTPDAPLVVTDDIGRFWDAFDALAATEGRAERLALLDRQFVEPGTPGLHGLMERRGYTTEAYLDAIEQSPRFWASVRANTLRAGDYAADVASGIEAIRAMYPSMRPVRVYFTVGALRSGGTLLGDRVVIGSELALADRTTVTDDLPEPMRDNLRRVFDDRTPGSIAQLIAHESVHTQQGPFASDLLSISLQEGVAEFVSTHALSVPSDAPAIAYGDAHADAVQSRFATVVGTPHLGQWLYSDRENDFGVRDLGYYVGYAIARGFHQQAGDPAAAITQMIDLDYQDAQAVAAFVDASGYFDLPVADLRAAYEHARPRVVAVDGLVDADGTTAPGPRRITFRFSRPIREGFRGFDYGPLGEDHVLQIREVIGLSDDGMALTVGVNLRLGHRHQVLLSEAFRALDDSPLVPYLVDVTTSG